VLGVDQDGFCDVNLKGQAFPEVRLAPDVRV
jgi:hypothetical protein